jgi:hypothetical protein
VKGILLTLFASSMCAVFCQSKEEGRLEVDENDFSLIIRPGGPQTDSVPIVILATKSKEKWVNAWIFDYLRSNPKYPISFSILGGEESRALVKVLKTGFQFIRKDALDKDELEQSYVLIIESSKSGSYVTRIGRFKSAAGKKLEAITNALGDASKHSMERLVEFASEPTAHPVPDKQ